jgi:hypothetical protein
VLEPQHLLPPRMADRALLRRRRDDGDVAKRRQRIRQGRESFRSISIIIGDKNSATWSSRLGARGSVKNSS